MKPSRLLLLTLSLGLLVAGGAALPTPAHAALDCLSAANPDNYCATVLSPGNNFCCVVRDSCFYDQCTASQCVSTPPTITGPSASSTTNSISVNWQTCYSANSKLEWGTVSATTGTYNGATVTNLTQYVQNHLLGVSGLLPSRQYFYMVTSCGSTGRCASSTERTVTTAAATGDTTAPTITNIVISAGSDRATFNWTTDENADSLVEYGTTLAFGTQVFDATLVTSHVVNLTGLTPLTTYYYRITSKDAPGNSSNSGALVSHFFTTVDVGQVDRVFTTGACTDSTGKSVQIGQCSTETPPQYCHSGGVLGLDCNYCGYNCAAGQTCRVDGSCTDNPVATPNNPYQCNPAECYGANGVFTTPAASNCNSNFQRCDANSVLKVRPDRVCTQWLTPLTTVTLTNPQSREKEQLSLSLTACTSLDPSGRCVTVAAGKHCQFSPLTLCKTTADCGGDLCVPPYHCSDNVTQICGRDADCNVGQGSTCVSDSITFFPPKDRAAIKFLTGSVQPGLTWGGGRCTVDQTVACVTDRDCPTRTPSQQCQFDPTVGRCSNDATKACTTNNSGTVCGSGNTCLVQTIVGRYPWELNQQVGTPVPQLSNGDFEQVEKFEDSSGRIVTTFPSRPWRAEGADASVRVIADPALAGTTTAGFNHALEISPMTLVDTGGSAPTGNFSATSGQTYYLSVRLRAAGPQKVKVSLAPDDPAQRPAQEQFSILDLNDQWTTRIISFTTTANLPATPFRLFLTCLPLDASSNQCSTTAFYADDLTIQTALRVAYDRITKDTTEFPRSCRLYPKEDSLSCDYISEGVRYLGQHGFCLQRDPQNSSTCVSWWPVDIIAGDGDFFGTQGKIGYNDREPLYMCAESRGLVAGGGNYYSNAAGASEYDPSSAILVRYEVRDEDVGADGCNLSTGATESGQAPQPICATLNGYYNESCGIINCVDSGSHYFNDTSPYGTPNNLDLQEKDIQWMDITVRPACFADSDACDAAGVPQGAVYRISRDNNWQFLDCSANIKDTKCKSLTFDSANVNGWGAGKDGEFNPGNAWGAKAVFTDSGLLTFIQFRYADGSANKGSILMSVNIRYRESCSTIVKVAGNGISVPWANRITSRTYRAQDLDYGYTTDFAPFGGAVEPAQPDRNDPSTWTTALNAEALMSTATGQGQSRSGSPYACLGNCSVKTCVGGANDGKSCSASSFCEQPDANGTGICQGVGSTVASNKGLQAITSTPNVLPSDFAQQRMMRLFAATQGAWIWSNYCAGGTNSGNSCFNSSQCTGGTCKGGYIPWTSGWNPPVSRCSQDKRPNAFDATNLTDYCGIPPSITNLKLNGSADDISIRNSQVVFLTLNTTADPEQVPLQRIRIDWKDENQAPPEVFEKTLAPQGDPSNPVVFTHVYTCSSTTPCTAQPRIQIEDNWGWCSTTAVGATNKAAICGATDVSTTWTPAKTITINP